MKRVVVLLALVMAITTVLAGCGKTDAKMDDIKKSGKLVIGTNAEYPPYEFHKQIDGKDQIVGMDISIAQAIADELGVQLEIKDMAFDGLLAALQAGKVDMVIAGMTPDEKRKKSVDFSKIYYQAQQGVVIRSEDKDSYKQMSDLDGKKVGVQLGTTQEEIAKTQVKDAKITAIASVGDLMLQLKSKKVDALIVELPVAQVYVSKNPELVIADAKPNDDVGGSAIAVHKKNPSLVKALDSAIDKLAAEKKIDAFFVDASNLMEK
ncbi:transporter substrate-binding domain-containing protein [Gorillibacterium massiliense]|uniref:transporter substrate-binding domain-containing protein n=1 Tax=Gorillibacterium massiliense TaxID=1280390 RepID=UPI0004BA9A1F|nr:transporter substrate-binding domain-containing protein [Gorillibacterium massiliense]